MEQDAPFREGNIAPAKLVNYLLKIRHEKGGSKAKFFINTCGFSRSRPQEFARALHAQLATAAYIGRRQGRRGTNHLFCGDIVSPLRKKICITTIWCISAPGATPHFVTARPAKKKERT